MSAHEEAVHHGEQEEMEHAPGSGHEQPAAHGSESHGEAPAHDTHAEPAHGDSHEADAHGAAHGDAHGDGHGGEHGGEHGGGIPELENAIDYILMGKTGDDLHTIHNTVLVGPKPEPGEQPHFMTLTWLDVINIFYAFFAVALLALIAVRVKSKLTKIPSGFQVLVEAFVKWMDEFVIAIIGHDGRKFTPFIGTIFIYILVMNYMGLVPFMKAPVALNINVPLSMAICVFAVVQYRGITQNGIVNYFKHFTGDSSGMLPLDLILMPLNFVLHVIGEIAKPITLSLRLFGNITGEDVVIAALVGLALGFLVPIQALFYPLAMLFGFIQALVFATLSAVYILLMSAHEEHH